MAIVRPTRPTPYSDSTAKATTPSQAPISVGKIEPPRRRPPPSIMLPKKEEMTAHDQETSTPRKATPKVTTGEKPETTKLAVAAGEPDSAGPRHADTRSDDNPQMEGQLTIHALQKMELPERHALWKRLNQSTPAEVFITVLRPDSLPKKVVMEYVPVKNVAPVMRGIRNVLWCCYCGDWTVFENFGYIGSDKCICCSISTKDFYNRSANKLWKVDV